MHWHLCCGEKKNVPARNESKFRSQFWWSRFKQSGNAARHSVEDPHVSLAIYLSNLVTKVCPKESGIESNGAQLFHEHKSEFYEETGIFWIPQLGYVQ